MLTKISCNRVHVTISAQNVEGCELSLIQAFPLSLSMTNLEKVI